jgi:membrane-associated protease RseP (regulator of RpoE activity)
MLEASMCSDYSIEPSEETSIQAGTSFEQAHALVADEFTIEEGFLDHGTPTFYVKIAPESKNAFLRLMKRLDAIGLIPVLREEERKYVLRIVGKPPVKPSRISINLLLFLATIGTTLLTGYLISPFDETRGLYLVDPIVGAATFTVSLLAVIGVHELSHKFAANRHGIEATAPYFIPGPPPPLGIGTLGAVIQQKSLAPNKDALFDLGISGPLIGFVVAVVVTIIGILISFTAMELEPSATLLPVPLFFDFLIRVLANTGFLQGGPFILLHPVAFAGWVGMFVTVINLIPAGMLDGGHAVRGLLGQKASNVLSIIAIIILLVLNPSLYWLMAIIAFFFSMQRHPGPLDDVSKLTTGRKIAAILLVAVFILCIAPSPGFL